MHSIPAPSVDCSSSEPPPAFPCRPCPTIRKRSPGRQRKSHIRAPADLIAWRGSLGLSARLIVVITHFMCLIAASMFFESRASAQIAPRPPSIDRFANFIAEASARFTVPAPWIRAIIQIESAGDEHAISPRGAMGLMQLMPATWVELSVRYELGLDPFDPRDNIMAGTAYVRELRDRFGSAGFLAAYHAGPTRYEQHLATGQSLPPDTVAYVAAVAPLLGDEYGERAAFGGRRAVPWRQSPLFIGRVDAHD
jgi:soluble lytic murein transglycosylase-like protein